MWTEILIVLLVGWVFGGAIWLGTQDPGSYIAPPLRPLLEAYVEYWPGSMLMSSIALPILAAAVSSMRKGARMPRLQRPPARPRSLDPFTPTETDRQNEREIGRLLRDRGIP
jgi:hypothetical protein